MGGLVITTILTSAVDSLNPVAITQQFVLQGMVKKPKHIWFFILATMITNFMGGILAYFGLITVFSNTIKFAIERFGQNLYVIEFIAGIIILILAFFSILHQKVMKLMEGKETTKDSEDDEKQQVSKKIRSVTPFSLAVLGVIATIVELSTALPYFAFLAVVVNYDLSTVTLIVILLIYNIIYSSPLMILYFIYRWKQELFERVYLILKLQMKKWSAILIPAVLGIVGIAFLFHSINLLLVL